MFLASIVYNEFSSAGIVEWHAERAPAGEGQVVGVARVLLGEHVRQHAGLGQEAVDEGGLRACCRRSGDSPRSPDRRGRRGRSGGSWRRPA